MFDDFGLVETVYGLSQGVVIRVADAPDRSTSFYLFKTLGIFNRQILDTPVAVMGEAVAVRVSGGQRLIQRVENRFGIGRGRHLSANDAASEDVDDKCHIDKANGRADIRKVRHPQNVRRGCFEDTVYLVFRTWKGRIALCCFLPFPTRNTLKPHHFHQADDRASGDIPTCCNEIIPNFHRAIAFTFHNLV